MNKITLKESLTLWQMKTPLKKNEHLSMAVLKGVLREGSHDSAFEHLSLCPWCRQRLWRIQESMDASNEAEDYVLPLAADAGLPQEATWITEDQKYKIEFRRILSDKAQRAVLIVRVQPPFNLAGKAIVVKDGNDRQLLCGQIGKDGEIAAIIENLDNLSLKKINIS